MSRLARLARAIRGDAAGLAAAEFALALPAVLGVGSFAIELTNYAVTNERVSMISLQTADNASRVGILASSSSQQLREVDVNDVLAAIRLQGGGKLALTTKGRVTISSIRGNADGSQSMEWQRCVGLKKGAGWDSSYGTMTTTPFTGMGPANQRVTAPAGSSAIFVEVNYEYTPMVTWYGSAKRKLTYISSFIVRDSRIAGAPTNPTSATVAACTQWTV